METLNAQKFKKVLGCEIMRCRTLASVSSFRDSNSAIISMAAADVSKKRKASGPDLTPPKKAKKDNATLAKDQKKGSKSSKDDAANGVRPGKASDRPLTKIHAKEKSTSGKTNPAKQQNGGKKSGSIDHPPAVADSTTTEQIPAVTNDFEDFDDDDEDNEGEEDDAPEDDQTAALLQGFESSDDDEDNEITPDAQALATVPSLPNDKALRARLGSAASDRPGVIYVGRVPHGFYEHQMRAYFSQFGDISRLRLSRNRRTGASKHYAFLEFESAEVAQIVADTMDNYLMFGHLLKVRLVPRDKVHADLFKNAGRRFKAVPWNRIERARLEKVDRDAWGKRVSKERARRLKKAERLRALGLEYEPTDLKAVVDVPVQLAVEVEAGVADGIENGANESIEAAQQQPEHAEVDSSAQVVQVDGAPPRVSEVKKGLKTDSKPSSKSEKKKGTKTKSRKEKV